jgi:hypothetical protein
MAVRTIDLKTEVCVVGGGMSGICAAVAAARHGAKVLLIHDRPVLGGNASSEVRMWICGAQGLDDHPNRDLLESGIIEEIRLKNMYRNPYGNWSIWDSILYEMIWQEPNIKLMANCTCLDGTVDGNRLKSIKAWQMTTETRLTIIADLFIDCSGDGILIPLSGADHRIGRESSAEFGEDIQPAESDRKTMGMSCLLQTRETDSLRTYIAPEWAKVYETDADLNHRPHDMKSHNFWWLELGGDRDSIHDAEEIKEELIKASFGIWDHIKNRDNHGAGNWQLEWAGFLPGKRESRRYIGDHVLTQNDIRSEGRFDDLVAYGGWPMDDHHPAGLNHKGDPTQFHAAPAPYGIPYRCLYSCNIHNLMCAGRNISATHAALSSTRVMATCALIGQAAGTAAAIAVENSLSPREVGRQRIRELKQKLMEDDCYLPWNVREISSLTRTARITSTGLGNAEILRDGAARTINGETHGWVARPGDQVILEWDSVQAVSQVRLVFDSDLSRGAFGKTVAVNMPCRYTQDMAEQTPPRSLVKAFRIQTSGPDGSWVTVFQEENNHQRLWKRAVALEARAVRLIVDQTWGDDAITVFEWDLE